MSLNLNLDLLTVGIAVGASVILGFAVFFQKSKSATNLLFLFFTIVNGGWSVFNYLNYHFTSEHVVLLFIRLVMFFAVLQTFCFFMLMWVFPEDQKKLPKKFLLFVFPVVMLTALLTLTPLVFSGIQMSGGGAVATPIPGPAIPLFGIVAVGLVVSGVYQLIRKINKTEPGERQPYRYLLLGVVLMFALIILFNFFLPTFLSNTRFIPLSAVFTLPFVLCTAYAIFKHRLFDVKVVSTEILVLVLALATFIEVIVADSTHIIIFRSSIFILVLAIGVLLIRSVLKEVKQREELQRLTGELQKANEQLLVLDKARAEFISIASHQLRTPPATIKWYVGAILSGDFGQLAADLKSALERVNVTNNSQIALIDDLLNASRIERGKLEFFFEPGDLQALAELTVEQLKPQAAMKKLELVYHKPDKPLPSVMLDKEKVRQVINNFIDNAIKYTKQGQIDVFLEQTTTDVVVKVKDSGRGVAPDVAPTLFDKYTRGKDAATAATGLGLGLYVAKVIIEQNKGKIWVESEGEGKGATFIFSLPINSTLEATSVVDLVEAQTEPTPTSAPSTAQTAKQ